jgi:2-amino-4-hydroxy-6-hydroxymethyldihydropteridine diphosphokinase
MSTRACIGLGSNLGDRRATLDQALAALRASPGIEALLASAYHTTSPVGGPAGQGPFLNAAAAFETTLSPPALLHRLQALEAAAGRVRSERWGERSLDLDLLLFGNVILDSEELTIPHPHLALRRFVLEPLAEVAPQAVDPSTGLSILALLENLDRTPRVVSLVGWPPSALAAIVAAIPPDWVAQSFPECPGAAPPEQPTFIAAPPSCKTERRALARSWPAGTPILFVPESNPQHEICAACLAATRA